MIRNWMTAIIATAGISFGCNVSPKHSDTQSLDNFARSGEAALHNNSCEGNFKLIEDLFSPDVDVINIHVDDDSKRSIVQARVESALRAVPTEIQVAYFGLGGIIEVTPQTHAICSQNLDEKQIIRMSEGGAKIKGCWKHQTDYLENADGEFSEDQRVVMYIDTDEQSIEHALVRTFGYVLSQVLVKLDHDVANGKLVNIENDPHFVAAKEQLTLAFLKDVAASNGKYTLDRYLDMIGSDVIKADELARRSGWDILMQNKPAAARSFMDYVFAEAFDSHYCSAATRKIMTDDFSGSSEAFAPISDAIKALSGDLKEVDAVEDLAKLNEETNLDSVKPTNETTAAVSDEKPGNELNLPTGVNYGLSGLALTNEGYSLFIGRIFRGVARVVGGIARGVFRAGRAVVIGAGRIIAGAARIVGRVAQGILRIGAGIIRGAGRIIVGFFRGAARVARGLIIGAGRVIRGAARLALGVGRAVIRGTGFVIRSIFGNSAAYATEAGMVLEKVKLDRDQDGIEDMFDLCSNTPAGTRVHKTNSDWMGCSGGQYRDRDMNNHGNGRRWR